MPVHADLFRAALSRFASGVTVVTARREDGRPHGLTVSAFSSLSLEPPLVLVCIDKKARAHDLLARSSYFAVHILRDDQEHLSRHFSSSLPDGGLFRGVAMREGLGSLPLIEDVLVTIECSSRGAHSGGDHTIYVGEVERVDIRNGRPLLYYRSDYYSLGAR